MKKLLFKKYNISEDDESKFKNYIFESFEEQLEEGKTLSISQENIIKDTLGEVIKFDDLLDLKMKKTNLLYEVFFREDYNGEQIQDKKLIGCTYNTNLNLYAEIKDLHAAQYGTESYIKRYIIGKEILIPEFIKDKNYFIYSGFFQLFEIAYNKLKKDRFIRTKNKCIRIIRNVLAQKHLTEKELQYLGLANFY
jgi:hypothetical protein